MVAGHVERGAGAFAHAVRQAALVEHIGAEVHFVPVAAENGHVAPGVAFAVGGAQVFGHLLRFFAQAGQADDERRFAVAPAAHGLEHGDAVFVFVFGR
jgi:hypothetical protein